MENKLIAEVRDAARKMLPEVRYLRKHESDVERAIFLADFECRLENWANGLKKPTEEDHEQLSRVIDAYKREKRVYERSNHRERAASSHPATN
jgi:hypothetical protein